MPAEPTEAELLRASCRGDTVACQQLIARHGPAVRATVRAFRLQDADAADAVQNTWLRMLTRGHTLRDPECLRGWLVTTAGRECLGLIRRMRREIPADLGADEVVAHVPGPEAAAVARDIRRVVAEAVAELTGRRRQLVDVLFYGPDQGYARLSESGIPHGSIGPTRGRVLRDLRRTMECRGVDTAAVA